jgi:hypothetical protein
MEWRPGIPELEPMIASAWAWHLALAERAGQPALEHGQ